MSDITAAQAITKPKPACAGRCGTGPVAARKVSVGLQPVAAEGQIRTRDLCRASARESLFRERQRDRLAACRRALDRERHFKRMARFARGGDRAGLAERQMI